MVRHRNETKMAGTQNKRLAAARVVAGPRGDGRADASIGELQARGVVVLTKAQMAAALQVCPRTVTAMMMRRKISFFKISRQLVRFSVEDALKRMNETVLVSAGNGCLAGAGKPDAEVRNPRGGA